ncbi:MAG: 30S ribosomal protein S1 [Candidatus Aureabacteria bacterium]|nr:30S ribosomal protein S1 [Candidatus Auribacterota bacterium]
MNEAMDSMVKDIIEEASPAAAPDVSDDQMRDMVQQTMQHLEEGKIVKGKVYGIRADYVVVDIGYKSEGLVPRREFERESSLQSGDEIEVLLENFEDADGLVVISKQKADKLKNWEKIVAASKEGDTVSGVITHLVNGGLMVDIGVEAFLPSSQIDIRYVKDKAGLIGQKYEFKIIKVNEKRKNIVLSRRELLEEQRERARQKLLAEIKEGDLRKGLVKNITDFGAFVDLGGLDGLLHITDMTWGRISHPSEVLAVGDTVEVKILNYDREKQRVSLGLKQKSPNPWGTVAERYPLGRKVKGRVVNIMPYGAFVELEDGVEGLVHISELSWTRKINHPSELLAIGDIIEVVVLKVESEQEKISLGIKQLEFNPWTVVAQKYPVNAVVKGKIRNMTSYGAFIELEDGIDGLIHVSDMSWSRKITHPSQMFKRGDKVEAMFPEGFRNDVQIVVTPLSVDQENKKISMGLKQLAPDPWEQVEQKYGVGEVVDGKVTKLASFGVFVELDSGIEGLVHISQVSERPFTELKDVINEGDKVRAQVLSIDKDERKISLSIKNFLEGKGMDSTQREMTKKAMQVEDTDTRLKDELEKRFGAAPPPSAP